MSLTAFSGQTVVMVPNDSHPIRHLEYFKTLNVDRGSSLGFSKTMSKLQESMKKNLYTSFPGQTDFLPDNIDLKKKKKKYENDINTWCICSYR